MKFEIVLQHASRQCEWLNVELIDGDDDREVAKTILKQIPGKHGQGAELAENAISHNSHDHDNGWKVTKLPLPALLHIRNTSATISYLRPRPSPAQCLRIDVCVQPPAFSDTGYSGSVSVNYEGTINPMSEETPWRNTLS